MSDENPGMEGGLVEPAAAPSVGSQLKAAREARQMSVGDIAMALKLGARQVEALEKGDWHGLPGQTFIRGFVRNYARLLQLDASPLMRQLDDVLESPQQRLALPAQKRQVEMPETGHVQRRDYAMALFGLLLVAVATAIYFLLPEDLSQLRAGLEPVLAIFSREEPAPAAPPPAASAEPVFPPGSTPQQVMNPQAVPPADGEAQSAATAPGSATPQVQQALQPPTTAAPAVPAAPAGQSGPAAAAQEPPLRLVFDQESWVEVKDRNGKVIFSQRNAAGTEKTIEGQGPFSLVIGNAPGVRLSLRGQPVNLASRMQGNVARLTLE